MRGSKGTIDFPGSTLRGEELRSNGFWGLFREPGSRINVGLYRLAGHREGEVVASGDGVQWSASLQRTVHTCVAVVGVDVAVREGESTYEKSSDLICGTQISIPCTTLHIATFSSKPIYLTF